MQNNSDRVSFSKTDYTVIILTLKKLNTIGDTNLSCAVADVAPEVAVCC
jgi:hypothetical protein